MHRTSLPDLGRTSAKFPALVASLVLLAACGSGSSPSSPSSSQPAPTPTPKPMNVVLIVSDDQESVSARDMPRMQSLIAAQGVTFQNAIATTPLCGPSRATLLTGRYAHSHQIRSNQPPLGGYGPYRDSGMEADSLPVWLKAAGYRTAYMGKYTNGYGAGWTSAPPGWDDWLGTTEPQAYRNFTYNDNGVDRTAPSGTYQTDFLATRALDFLSKTEEKDDQPFFLMVTPYAPHNKSQSAARHNALFSDRGAPRTPAFDEPDVADKPRHIRRIGRYTSATVNAIDSEYRNSLRSLQAVDEMIEKIVQALTTQGELENTAIVFMSDNGISTGAHRFWDKTAPYAESLDIPLVRSRARRRARRHPATPRGEHRHTGHHPRLGSGDAAARHRGPVHHSASRRLHAAHQFMAARSPHRVLGQHQSRHHLHAHLSGHPGGERRRLRGVRPPHH
jgi:N-acetylglucosamine-6-sulfatase